jgi:hypothetical protein
MLEGVDDDRINSGAVGNSSSSLLVTEDSDVSEGVAVVEKSR